MDRVRAPKHCSRPRARRPRACTKAAWDGSEASKRSTVGKRLGADQKGAPVEVLASSGNVNTSCAILGASRKGGGAAARPRGWEANGCAVQGAGVRVQPQGEHSTGP